MTAADATKAMHTKIFSTSTRPNSKDLNFPHSGLHSPVPFWSLKKPSEHLIGGWSVDDDEILGDVLPESMVP